MSLAEDFNAPLIEQIGGAEYTFPLLKINDLAAVSREIVNEKKVAAIQSIDLSNKEARSETAAYFDSLELDVDVLGQIALTVTGARRILARSLAIGGTKATPDLFDTLIAERGAKAFVSLACTVSRIFGPPRRNKSPNAGAASANQPGAVSSESNPQDTGSNASSSADSSAAVIPAN